VPDRPAKGRVAQRTQKPKWEERLGRAVQHEHNQVAHTYAEGH